MAKDYAKSFYKSRRWQKCRKNYIAYRISVDGGTCEICHKEQGYIVHHKRYITESNIKDPDITLNPTNLQYVCKECHDKLEGHGVGKKKPLLVLFDENGQPINKVLPP